MGDQVGIAETASKAPSEIDPSGARKWDKSMGAAGLALGRHRQEKKTNRRGQGGSGGARPTRNQRRRPCRVLFDPIDGLA